MPQTSGSLRYPQGSDPVNIPGDIQNLAVDVDDKKAPLASPQFTGIPKAPTASLNTTTTQIATTAFVINQGASNAPPAVGTPTAGTSTRFARADHTHALPDTTYLTPSDYSNTAATSTAATAEAGTANSVARRDHVHALHAHKSTHASGGSDALSPSDIGALALSAFSGTKGDLITNTAVGTTARLAVGTTNTALIADSSQSTGMRWGALSSRLVPTIDILEKTESYSLSLEDAGFLVEMNASTEVTLTIPNNSSVAFPVGTKIELLQTGLGQVTISGAEGVTVASTPGLKISGQWGAASLVKRATNTWVVVGNLSA